MILKDWSSWIPTSPCKASWLCALLVVQGSSSGHMVTHYSESSPCPFFWLKKKKRNTPTLYSCSQICCSRQSLDVVRTGRGDAKVSAGYNYDANLPPTFFTLAKAVKVAIFFFNVVLSLALFHVCICVCICNCIFSYVIWHLHQGYYQLSSHSFPGQPTRQLNTESDTTTPYTATISTVKIEWMMKFYWIFGATQL